MPAGWISMPAGWISLPNQWKCRWKSTEVSGIPVESGELHWICRSLLFGLGNNHSANGFPARGVDSHIRWVDFHARGVDSHARGVDFSARGVDFSPESKETPQINSIVIISQAK